MDAGGNVYLATYQHAQGEPFTDMVIYKFDSDGEERWQARWGGKFMEKAFVAATAGPNVGAVGYRAAKRAGHVAPLAARFGVEAQAFRGG